MSNLQTNRKYQIDVANRFTELIACEEHTTDELWLSLKDATIESAKTTVPCARKKRQDWISVETLDKISERRKLKAAGISSEDNRDLYAQYNRDVQRNMRQDRQRNIDRQCAAIEQNVVTNIYQSSIR